MWCSRFRNGAPSRVRWRRRPGVEPGSYQHALELIDRASVPVFVRVDRRLDPSIARETDEYVLATPAIFAATNSRFVRHDRPSFPSGRSSRRPRSGSTCSRTEVGFFFQRRPHGGHERATGHEALANASARRLGSAKWFTARNAQYARATCIRFFSSCHGASAWSTVRPRKATHARSERFV